MLDELTGKSILGAIEPDLDKPLNWSLTTGLQQFGINLNLYNSKICQRLFPGFPKFLKGIV